jgi:large conductance mechanosensitive channel
MRGNVVDLAVGVVIGAAFGQIVNSLVGDILMPPIGKLISNMDFTNLYVPLYELPKDLSAYPKTLVEAKKYGSVVAYGNFITISINFVIVAACIFLVVKLVNMAERHFEKEKAAAPPPPPSADVKLLTEIRDLLKQRS